MFFYSQKMKAIFFSFLCGMTFFLHPAPTSAQEQLFSYQDVSLRVDFLGGEDTLPRKKEWLGEVLKNLRYFECEVLGHSWHGQSTSLYKIKFQPDDQGERFAIEIQTLSGKSFSFVMKKLETSVEGFLRSFKLEVVNESSEYSILNTQIDEEGDVLERVIVLTHSLVTPWIPEKCQEFVEGQWCSYSQYQDHHFTAYEIKTFLLDMYGKMRFVRSRDGILSGLDSKKIMERETQTEYSFSGSFPFKIVNLQMEEHGRITAFDLMNPQFFEKESFRESLHFDVRFLSFHGFGSLEKLSRLYQWKQGKKVFLSGMLSENRLNREVQVEQMKDTWFDIPPNQEGLLPGERILQREHIIFPVLSQKSVKTQDSSRAFFEEKERNYWIRFQPFVIDGKTERKPVFESIRDVRYCYLDDKKQKINRIQVDFFEVTPEEKKLQKNREVTIDLLQVSALGQPVELRMKIDSPRGEAYEERITSDCRYVIEQAMEGDLFVLKEKKPHVVCLGDFTPEGPLGDVWVYSVTPGTEPAVVTKVEKIRLSSL